MAIAEGAAARSRAAVAHGTPRRQPTTVGLEEPRLVGKMLRLFGFSSALRLVGNAGGRVVVIGTTALRALESAAARGELDGRTDLFIRGDHEFAVTDLLLTNFHLPRSSLLVLIDAFVGPRWRRLYADALDSGYRFLSFGDAMLLQRGRGT